MNTPNTEKNEKGESPPVKPLNELPFKEFNTKSKHSQSFSLKVYQAEKSIIFKIKEIDDIGDTLYKTESSLEIFYSLNRIFRQFLSTEELFSLFFKIYKDSNIKVIKKDNQIKLSFIIEFMGKKDEITFTLNPEQSKIENVVMNLCQKVKELDSLNRIIKEQKEANNNLKKKYDNFKKNVDEKINKILNTEMQKMKSENNNKVKE